MDRKTSSSSEPLEGAFDAKRMKVVSKTPAEICAIIARDIALNLKMPPRELNNSYADLTSFATSVTGTITTTVVITTIYIYKYSALPNWSLFFTRVSLETYSILIPSLQG